MISRKGLLGAAAGLAIAMVSGANAKTEWQTTTRELSGGRTLVRSTAVVDGLPVANATRSEMRDASGAVLSSAGLEARDYALGNRVVIDADAATNFAVRFLVETRPGFDVGGGLAARSEEPKLVGYRVGDAILAAFDVSIPVTSPKPDLIHVFVDAQSGDVYASGGVVRHALLVTPTPKPPKPPSPDKIKMNVFKSEKARASGNASSVSIQTDAFSPDLQTTNSRVQARNAAGSSGSEPAGDPLLGEKPGDFKFEPIETPAYGSAEFDVCNLFWHVDKMANYFDKTVNVKNMAKPIQAFANPEFDSPNAYAVDDTVVFSNQGTFVLTDAAGNTRPIFVTDFSKIPDFVYHEVSHIAYSAMVPGETFYPASEAGSRNEGTADFYAASYSGDPVIGPPDNPLEISIAVSTGSAHEVARDLRDNLVYPTNPYYDAKYYPPPPIPQPCLDGPEIFGTTGTFVLARKGTEPHHGGKLWGAALWSAAKRVGTKNAGKDVRDGLLLTQPDSPFANSVAAIYSAAPGGRQAKWLGAFAKHGLSGVGAVGTRTQNYRISSFTVDIGDSVVGGYFTITINGSTTAPISPFATAGELQFAIEQLPIIGACNSGVTGGPGPAKWGITIAPPGGGFGTDFTYSADNSHLLSETAALPRITVSPATDTPSDLLVYDESFNVAEYTVDPSSGVLTPGGPIVPVGSKKVTIPSTVVKSIDAPLVSPDAPVTHVYHLGIGNDKSVSIAVRDNSSAMPVAARLLTYDLSGGGPFTATARVIADIAPNAGGDLVLSDFDSESNAFGAFILEVDFAGTGNYSLQVSAD